MNLLEDFTNNWLKQIVQPVPFGTLRKRAEATLQKKLGVDATYGEMQLARKYSTPVAEGKLSADQAIKEIRRERHESSR